MYGDEPRNSLVTLIASLATLIMLAGCQTPRHAEFAYLKQGMEKHDVLAVVGGPDASQRWQGKDRWIYNFNDHPEGAQTKEVHFENGKAVYVGGKVVPEVSAVEQDRLNAAAETEAQKREREQNLYRTEFVGVAGATETGSSEAPHVNQYLGKASLNEPEVEANARFNESMYGVPKSPEFEQRKVAPNFEEVNSSDENSSKNSGAR